MYCLCGAAMVSRDWVLRFAIQFPLEQKVGPGVNMLRLPDRLATNSVK